MKLWLVVTTLHPDCYKVFMQAEALVKKIIKSIAKLTREV
jgi:hypothetical protein